MASYDGESMELIKTKVVKGIGESPSQEGIEIREGTGLVCDKTSHPGICRTQE